MLGCPTNNVGNETRRKQTKKKKKRGVDGSGRVNPGREKMENVVARQGERSGSPKKKKASVEKSTAWLLGERTHNWACVPPSHDQNDCVTWGGPGVRWPLPLKKPLNSEKKS